MICERTKVTNEYRAVAEQCAVACDKIFIQAPKIAASILALRLKHTKTTASTGSPA